MISQINPMTIQKINKYLIAASVFLIPFYFFRFSVLGIKTNVFEIAILLSFLSFIVFLTKEKKKIIYGPVWPYLFLIIALISAYFSSDKTTALGIFKGWFFVPIVFYWLIINNFKQKELYKLNIALFASLIIVSFWAILQRFGIIGTLFYQSGDVTFLQYIADKRVFGPFESPNFLAMFIVPVAFLSLPLLFEAKAENFSLCSKNILVKIFALVSFSLPITALYFSGSKGGLWAFIIGMLVYLNYTYINKQKSKDRRPVLATLIVTCLFIGNYLYFYVISHLANLSGSNESRKEIYKHSIQLLKNNFINGVGLGGFNDAIAQVSVNDSYFKYFILPYALHPHNLLLAIWLNLGILGLLLFVVILIDFLKNAFSSDLKIKATILAAIMAIMVHGLFDTTYFKNDLSAIFWLIFAFSIIIGNKNETKEINN